LFYQNASEEFLRKAFGKLIKIKPSLYNEDRKLIGKSGHGKRKSGFWGSKSENLIKRCP
jgi:hypothetical protein